MLNQWPALQAYFNSYEDETSVKVRDLAGYLNDPEIKFDFLFLSAALKPLVAFNTAFQGEGVLIHKLHNEMTRLVKRYLGYILPARAIANIPVREVSLGQEHQLKNEDLFIGAEARAFLEKEELPSVTMTKIYQTVRDFYVEAIRKLLKAFPLDSPLLQDLDALDPASRLDLSPETG
ncbi:unnamed protein product [Gadus morhua 'NCC']